MKTNRFLILATAAALCLGFGACKQKQAEPAADVQTGATQADNIYQFSVLDGDSNTVSLDQYEGKVLLVVNTATHCGFTPQYADLQKLYDLYHTQGLEILDFPCNQFGEQAPEDNAGIAAFCTGNYGTTFAQLAKIEVNGENQAPVYAWLKSKAGFAGFDTTDRIGAYLDQSFRAENPDYDQNPDIKWNFTKFLVGRDGTVICRMEPTAGFDQMEQAIKAAL